MLELRDLISLSETGEEIHDQAVVIEKKAEKATLVRVSVLLAAAALFITWLHRASRNQVHLGASRIRFGPGWTIGGWFVPILNLFFMPAAVAGGTLLFLELRPTPE